VTDRDVLPARAGGRRTRVSDWFTARLAVRTQGWRRTDALVRAVVCGLGLLVAGVLLHRLELVLIGLPLMIGVLLTTPPSGTPEVVSRPHEETVEAGGETTVAVTVTPGKGAAFAALRMPRPGASGAGPVHLLPAVTGEVRSVVSWHAWGHGIYQRPDYLFGSHDGMYLYGPVVGIVAHHTVLPQVEPLPTGPLPPRAAGLVGAHRSARAGDGMELRDIRPFRSGDRLRRVDWRVSLRAAAARGGSLSTGTLHVREQHAEADADLVLAIDTRLDVDEEVGDWNARPAGALVRPGGSLDVGVRTATSLAAAFLRQGDRVGLVDLGHPRGGVPVGAGLRHLRRIRHQLVHSAGRVAGSGDPVLSQAQVPAGATVLVLSPFLDDKVADLAIRLARLGRLVVAVDLLPAELRADRTTPWGQAVVSILRAEHAVRVRALEERGVPVLRWETGATIGALLRVARRRRRS
jgi:uncharacterized protein (DUF58 family)